MKLKTITSHTTSSGLSEQWGFYQFHREEIQHKREETSQRSTPAHQQHTGLSLGICDHELLPAKASLCIIRIEKIGFAKQNYAMNKKAENLF